MEDSPKTAKGSAPAETWEDEGGSLTPEEAAKELGVVQSTTETFSVGGYRYTKLMHAIAEARRMRSAAEPE